MTNKRALVTGASDGIGLEFCRALARRQYDLVLVARREDKLAEVAAELETRWGVSCTVVPCDLAAAGAAQQLFATVKSLGINIDFLVNNAGMLCNGYFVELPLEQQEAMMMVNMLALTSLSHLFGRQMQLRGEGIILNVASTAAWMPIPNQNVYAATKAYVLSFTQALSDEMNALDSGVKVTALCPGYTATKMLDNPEQGKTLQVHGGLTLPAETVAEKGVAAALAGKPTFIPGLSNRLVAGFTQVMPKMLIARLAGKAYRKYMGE